MRLICMRHGESCNNILAQVSKDKYENLRMPEPDLTSHGYACCIKMGMECSNMGMKFDRIICSG